MTLSVTFMDGRETSYTDILHVMICTYGHLTVYLRGLVVPVVIHGPEWRSFTVTQEKE